MAPSYRGFVRTLGLTTLVAVMAGETAAHVGSLEGATTGSPVPQWFVVIVAGTVVGASFLFTSLMADHEALRWVNSLGRSARFPTGFAQSARRILGHLSAVALLAVIVVGFFGPSEANANAASLVVWVGWWGAFTVSAYAVGNSWPAVNPFRRLATLYPSAPSRDYPEELGAWPAVVGILALVWFEVVSAATERPRMLAGLIVAYTLVTLAGSAVYGRNDWFANADPLAAVFRTYGHLAPLQRTETGIELRLPGAALTDGDTYRKPGQVGFVIALLWATTFDGFVSTPFWEALLAPLVVRGVPAIAVYVLVLAAGFVGFYAAYRWAARLSRDSADTYVTPDAIARWLAPSLVPIAAGYHIAHFSGYVITLWPALLAALQAPIVGPAEFTVLLLPEWFGFVKLGFVLLGHLLAIWVAHSIAFDLFPGARQPIRSQYPLIVVMIAYTLVSAWVIVSPTVPTPYV